jgi:CBS-domain-containing membrane protein
MVLRLSTAAELMTRNPLTFEKYTRIQKASALLEFNDLEAAPVVDEHDRPLGLVTAEACAAWNEFCARSSPHGFVSEEVDEATVDQILSPVTEIVHEDDSSRHVIQKLLWQRLRRVYVVNDDGKLVGVVSTADVLGHLLAGQMNGRPLGAGASLLC